MTPSELHNHFMLNTTTGRLFQPCGSLRKGYRRVHVADRTFAEHRVVFAMVHGRWPDGMIDHINGDRTDNRPCNLREATHAQNAQNSKANKNNSTGYRGVHWHKGERKYRARINANGVAHNLGSFAHPGIAALIYVTASTRLHGNFASLTHQVAA